MTPNSQTKKEKKMQIFFFHMPYDNVMELTAQPIQSEPQRATMVLSTTTGVADLPLGGVFSASPLSLASKIVDLGISPSSMPSLSIFCYGRLQIVNNKMRNK